MPTRPPRTTPRSVRTPPPLARVPAQFRAGSPPRRTRGRRTARTTSRDVPRLAPRSCGVGAARTGMSRRRRDTWRRSVQARACLAPRLRPSSHWYALRFGKLVELRFAVSERPVLGGCLHHRDQHVFGSHSRVGTEALGDLPVHGELRLDGLTRRPEHLDLNEVVAALESQKRSVGELVLAVLRERHEAVALLDGHGLQHRLVDLVHQRLLVLRRLAFTDCNTGHGHLAASSYTCRTNLTIREGPRLVLTRLSAARWPSQVPRRGSAP